MVDVIREVLVSEPRIAYALLFGSQAAGRATAHSDLDIAVGSSSGDGFDPHTLGTLVASLERATDRTVDVIVLDQAPPAVAYRVFRDGRLLVEVDPSALTRGRARAILGYLDFKPVEQLCARAFSRARRMVDEAVLASKIAAVTGAVQRIREVLPPPGRGLPQQSDGS